MVKDNSHSLEDGLLRGVGDGRPDEDVLDVGERREELVPGGRGGHTALKHVPTVLAENHLVGLRSDNEIKSYVKELRLSLWPN